MLVTSRKEFVGSSSSQVEVAVVYSIFTATLTLGLRDGREDGTVLGTNDVGADVAAAYIYRVRFDTIMIS